VSGLLKLVELEVGEKRGNAAMLGVLDRKDGDIGVSGLDVKGVLDLKSGSVGSG
jgi:hypothetical protein